MSYYRSSKIDAKGHQQSEDNLGGCRDRFIVYGLIAIFIPIAYLIVTRIFLGVPGLPW